MTSDLYTYIDAIDARLGADDDLDRSLDGLRQVQYYAFRLLTQRVDPEQVHEEWPGFFRLAVAFVLAHGSPRLCHLQQAASLFEGWGDDPLTDYDRDFLVALMHEVDELVGRTLSGE
jgi:hypothetical protein